MIQLSLMLLTSLIFKPENISFVRVNKSTGEIDKESTDNFYFELFLDENIN